MDIIDILSEVSTTWKTELLFIVLLVGSMVKIPKIEINFWDWLGTQINKATLEEVKASQSKIEDLTKSIEDVKVEFSAHLADESDYVRKINTDNVRHRILRFADDLKNGVTVSEEHFIDILDDIDTYERYCIEHPTYKNGKAVHAITFLNEEYDRRYNKIQDKEN